MIVPNEWCETTLQKCTAKIGSGKTPRGGESIYVEDGVLFIRSQNVYPHQLFLDKRVYIPYEIDKSMLGSRLQNGDVLLNITGASIGRSCVFNLNTNANVNQHVCIIRTLKNVDPYFLCAFLNSDKGQDQIRSFLTKGNREGLNFQQIGSFKLVLPPLREQKKITEILSCWDRAIEIIEAIERKISLCLNQLCSQFYFSKKYKEVILGDIIVLNYGKSPTNVISNNGKFPIIGTGGETGRTNVALTTKPTIIIGRKGTIDKPQFIKSPCWPIDTTYFVTLKSDIDLSWLYYYLRTFKLETLNESSGIPSLNRENIYAIKANVPDLKSQQLISHTLRTVDLLRLYFNRLRHQVVLQKQGLMQQLLTGKIRVKVSS